MARCLLMLIACSLTAHAITVRYLQEPSSTGGCGRRSLYAVARQLGLPHSMETVASLFAGDNPTSNFAEIQRVAERIGLEAEGRRMTVAELGRVRPLGVLHVDGHHFVALVGYAGDALELADPAYAGEPRRVRWLDADLAARWDGRILILRRH